MVPVVLRSALPPVLRLYIVVTEALAVDIKLEVSATPVIASAIALAKVVFFIKLPRQYFKVCELIVNVHARFR